MIRRVRREVGRTLAALWLPVLAVAIMAGGAYLTVVP